MNTACAAPDYLIPGFVARMGFSADGLTAGVKPQNTRLLRVPRTARGRNSYPRVELEERPARPRRPHFRLVVGPAASAINNEPSIAEAHKRRLALAQHGGAEDVAYGYASSGLNEKPNTSMPLRLLKGPVESRREHKRDERTKVASVALMAASRCTLRCPSSRRL